MKYVRIILGSLLVLIGGTWLLQGINLLGGSPMTGQTRWAVIGAIAVVVGLLQVGYTLRRR